LRLRAEQLPAALARGLAGIYLVSGDEPLLVGEAADAIRAAARRGGFADRSVFFIDRSFGWDELRLASQSLSLFAERRLFELRMPSGKPDKGAALLADLAAQAASDLIYLVITDKLDRKAGDAPWVRAIEEHGAWVSIVPVDSAAAHRYRSRGLPAHRRAGRGQPAGRAAGVGKAEPVGEWEIDRRRVGPAVGGRQRAL
jgi:DNA polymerase-3 subunit delta